LSVHGVGPETADDILLYAFDRPVFVIDAYTRRLLGRLGHPQAQASYEEFRASLEAALGADVGLFNEYHALIVAHGKGVCRPRPRCDQCVLSRKCELGSAKLKLTPSPSGRGAG
jgi:endonuclease-3 related protein